MSEFIPKNTYEDCPSLDLLKKMGLPSHKPVGEFCGIKDGKIHVTCTILALKLLKVGKLKPELDRFVIYYGGGCPRVPREENLDV